MVFSTNDGGETWKPNVVSNDFNLQDAYFGKNKLFFLLAGFGQLEDSSFVSNDEGKSWTRRPTKNVGRDGNKVYFANDKVGWIVPIVGKNGDCVYRTNDGGKNWR